MWKTRQQSVKYCIINKKGIQLKTSVSIKYFWYFPELCLSKFCNFLFSSFCGSCLFPRQQLLMNMVHFENLFAGSWFPKLFRAGRNSKIRNYIWSSAGMRSKRHLRWMWNHRLYLWVGVCSATQFSGHKTNQDDTRIIWGGDTLKSNLELWVSLNALGRFNILYLRPCHVLSSELFESFW